MKELGNLAKRSRRRETYYTGLSVPKRHEKKSARSEVVLRGPLRFAGFQCAVVVCLKIGGCSNNEQRRDYRFMVPCTQRTVPGSAVPKNATSIELYQSLTASDDETLIYVQETPEMMREYGRAT